MSDTASGLSDIEIRTATDVPADTPFEDAMAELEKCVDALESGEVGLDEALVLFRRGTALQAWCVARLEAIRSQVEELTGGPGAEDEPGP